jgi:hypothetical protein
LFHSIPTNARTQGCSKELIYPGSGRLARKKEARLTILLEPGLGKKPDEYIVSACAIRHRRRAIRRLRHHRLIAAQELTAHAPSEG